ncbi:hypothetical protein O9G_004765 [Rozella allomycis CSF55]|uniref:Uncharacterized protein n=1 Tax=Rozella allomycis (strain CSF55) TaxID=988480 RepID=A0A075ARQ7_ROZAC|nr:hypothetical protein O9G_004765 [Rozella allomycis CSF55]|eukprot:EPZ31203.1 hypothetical protein O9G_004765 [Rozella allomycis CSF55]
MIEFKAFLLFDEAYHDLNRDLSSIYGIRPKNNRASNNINASFQKVTPASAEKQDIDVDDDKENVPNLESSSFHTATYKVLLGVFKRHKLSLVADLIDEEKYWPVLVKMASHSIYDKDSFTRILDYTHTRPQMYIVHLIVMAQRPWAFEVYLEKYTVIFVELLRFNLMKAEKLIQKRHEENIIQLNQIQDLAFVLEARCISSKLLDGEKNEKTFH